MRQASKRIPESGTPIPLSPKKLPAGGLVCLSALKTLGNFRAPTRGAAAVFLSRPSSSFPTASSRYWSRALSARKWSKYTDRSAYYEAEAVALGDTMGERVEAKALARSVTNDFESYVKLNKRVPPEVVGVVRRIEDYAELADTHKEKKRSTTRFAPPSSARLRFQRLIVPPPLCRT